MSTLEVSTPNDELARVQGELDHARLHGDNLSLELRNLRNRYDGLKKLAEQLFEALRDADEDPEDYVDVSDWEDHDIEVVGYKTFVVEYSMNHYGSCTVTAKSEEQAQEYVEDMMSSCSYPGMADCEPVEVSNTDCCYGGGEVTSISQTDD